MFTRLPGKGNYQRHLSGMLAGGLLHIFTQNYQELPVNSPKNFPSDPRREHGEAIVYLVCYLKKTRHIGLKLKPDPSTGFECYCDADFSGNWNKDLAP
jgi:hypothetical protein